MYVLFCGFESVQVRLVKDVSTAHMSMSCKGKHALSRVYYGTVFSTRKATKCFRVGPGYQLSLPRKRTSTSSPRCQHSTHVDVVQGETCALKGVLIGLSFPHEKLRSVSVSAQAISCLPRGEYVPPVMFATGICQVHHYVLSLNISAIWL